MRNEYIIVKDVTSFFTVNYNYKASMETKLHALKLCFERVKFKTIGHVLGVSKEVLLKCAHDLMIVKQFFSKPNNKAKLITLNSKDKAKTFHDCQTLNELRFTLFATKGTHQYLKKKDISLTCFGKIYDELYG